MRRFWMLLLAVMVLAAFLAVPAMAETTEETHLHGTCTDGSACTACAAGHTEWTELTASTTSITESGNYYLNADSVAAGITVTGDIEVTICLNGKVWTNPDSATRPLYVKEGAKVNIVDCSNQSAISETDSTPVSGGSIQSTVDRSAESTGEEGYRTNTMGGAIYVSGQSELNIYNGTIDGGYVYSGGTIYTTNSAVNIYGGHITGGKARTGGNIYMASGTLTVDGANAVISAGTTTKKVSIENSDTTTKEEYDPNGGNIYTGGGTMYLKAGVIRDGAAMGTAGNVRIGGVFNMSGGTIIGGIKITNEDTGTYNTTDGNANMQIVGSQSHVLSGGTITGHVTTYKTVKITVSGDMVFAEVDEDGNVIGGLGLQGNTTGDTKIVIGEGGLGDNALIAVYKTTGWAVVDKTADEAQWNTIKGYLTSGKLRGFNNYKLTLEAADADAEKAEAIYARSTTDATRYSCLCGHNPGEEHIGECDGYAVPWTAWELTGSNGMPDSAGYWYLVDADGTADNAANVKRTNITSKNGIYVDFNGVQVTQGTIGTAYNDNIRFGNLWCDSTSVPTLIVYTDASQGHTGKLISAGDGVKDANGTIDHSNIWLRASTSDDKLTTTVTCYRLSVDCSGKTNSYGSGFSVGKGNFLNLYECDVIGGTASGSTGGAIQNQGTTTVVGGSLSGGSANTSGGVIYNAGTMTLTDVEINGGSANTSGGAIYTITGTLTVKDCTINGGTSGRNGGAVIIVSGSATFNNTDITAEEVEDGAIAAQSGAAIYVNDGTLTVENGTTVTGGAATNGGAVYVAGGSFIAQKGLKADGETVGDAVTITGGTASAYGGAVYMAGGSFTAQNGTVIDGGTAAEGGAVYIAAGAQFTLDASTVQNGTSIRDSIGTETNTADDDNINDGKGSNFYVLGTLLVKSQSLIQGGSVNVLNSDRTYDNDDGNVYGGSAIYAGNGAVVTVSNSTVNGNTTSKLWKRAGTIYNYKGTVNLTNSTVTASAVNTDSGVIWNCGGTVNLTGGTLDASNLSQCEGLTSITYGGAVRNTSDGTTGVFNMYGGTIIGFKVSATNGGGAVYNNATFNMTGGIIQGGSTTATGIGGNVACQGGTFTLNGGTIQGGEAYNGGNVYLKSGTFDMKKGTITGGVAVYGGNVYVSGGTFKMSGTESLITLGIAKDSAAGSSSTYAYGGNVYMTNGSGTFTMTGGATISFGACLDTTETAWSPGGNIYCQGGTLNVTDSTIIDGQNTTEGLKRTQADGNNIYINYYATVNLNSGAVVHNTADNSQESILVQGGRLNINGATITNAEGVKSWNIRCNSSALTNKKNDAYHFEYVDNAPVITMTGGTISGGNTSGAGANVVLSHLAQFNMSGGTIENGASTTGGGNIYVEAQPSATIVDAYNAKFTDATKTASELAGKVSISGSAQIVNGSSTASDKNGGSIYMGSGTTLTVTGDAEIYGGSAANCGGNIYSNGYVTIGGKAKVYDGNAKNGSVQPNIFIVSGWITLQDEAQVAGGIGVHGTAATATLKGSPVVDKDLTSSGKQQPTQSLKIMSGALLVLDGLTADADVNLTCDVKADYYAQDEASKAYVISGAIGDNDITGICYETADYFIITTADNKLALISKEDASGAIISNSNQLFTLEEAVANVGEGEYITLLSTIENATISKSVQLDLDGNSLINLTLAEGVELKLFDASTEDYKVEEDADNSSNGYSGYGIVTLNEEASKGTILRQANTPKATYGHNYRYVVLKDEEGYHAHRIYLAVKSTILYPNKAAVNYRTALRCDQLVAKYINAEGGGFGILASADSTSYSDYTENNKSASPWDGENENNLITQLNSLLDDPDQGNNEKKATTKVKAQAYIYLADQFTGNALAAVTDDDDTVKAANAALIASEGLTSSGVNQSLQGMVQIAFAKDPDTLDSFTKDALYNMYSKWSSGLMESWSLRYLQEYKELYEGVDMRYACLCGHPESTDNPCADNGHMQITWRAWNGSTFPSESGNYYLTEDLVLTSQGSVGGEDFINLNTNGYDISVSGNRRVANVYGVLNLTNFSVDGQTVEESFITATSPEAGNGGVLLILNDATLGEGNVSLYSGVTLAAQEDHNICYGVVEVGGDLNIYGGTVQGTTLNTSKQVDGVETDITSNGGALNVTSKGYVYMNSGSIIGGEAMRGGAIYVGVNSEGESTAVVELAGGTITGGTANDGGMIYMAGGTLLNNGTDLDASDCVAYRGGMMYLAGGQVAMAGTADDKLTLTGGNVVTVIKSVEDLNAAQPTDSDGKVKTDASVSQAGSGGVFYVTGGTLDLEYCTVNGGATKQIPLDGNPDVSLTRTAEEGKAAIGSYSNDLDSHGGSVLYLLSGQVDIDACEINGYADAMVNKRGGTIYMVGGEVTVDGDENVTGSSTLTAGWSGVNGTVLYQTGGTFTLNEGATLTSADIFADGGKLKYGATYGGTVSLASGSNPLFNMNGGTITGGKIKASIKTDHGGGNVSVTSGTFNMYGGEITNGVSLATAVSAELTGGGNVRINGGRFNMTGGSITGGEAVNGLGGGLLLKSGTLSISGNARITGNTDGDENANNVYLASGMTIKLGKLESVDNVSPEIGVTMATAGGNVTSGNTETTEQALVNAWLASDEGLDMVQVDGTDFFIGRYGCICGATGAEEHIGECVGTAVLWTPWLDEDHLPDQAGYWYLAYEGDVTVTEQASIGYNGTTDMDVVVDLNGKTVTRAVTDENNRFFAICTTETEGVVNSLTITDSSVGHTGKLICAETTDQGLGVWAQQDEGVLNIYRGTIDASGSTASTYGGLALYVDGGQVNMYGGKLIGGTTHKDGGTVYMSSGTGFTMTGGQIVAGQALCTQKTNGTAEVTSGDVTYTYTKYTCSDHGQGGAVFIENGASFSMSGGSVTAPTLTEEALATYRGAGSGGLFYVEGELNLSGNATVSGGRANGAGVAIGASEMGHSDCGYGGNISISGETVSGVYVLGVVNISSSDVTISDGFATGGALADATYTDSTTQETKTLSGHGAGGGGLGGNIFVGGGELNLTAGTLEDGEATTGGNIGTNNWRAIINLGVPADKEGEVAEKAVEILNGTAGSGGNIAINVRPCTSFTINRGTWIEGGHATNNGGNIYVSPWMLETAQYVQLGTDDAGKTLYETEYEALLTVNGGTVTGGVSGNLGGNVYIYGRQYTKSDAYGTVDIYAKLILGEGAVISNGAAAAKGNNLYVNSYADATVSGTISNTLPQGPWPSEGTAEYTVSKDSVYVGTITSHLTMEATGSIVNEKAADAEELPHIRNLYVNSGFFTMNGGTISGGYLVEKGDSGANVVVNAGTSTKATFTMNGGEIKDGVYGYAGTSTGSYEVYNGGGNVYVKGIFQMRGGVISGGKCLAASGTDSSSKTIAVSGHGGNVLIYGGQFTMDGNSQIKDGKVAYSGGNVYLANAGTLTMDSADASITGGMSTWYNGGNVYVNSGCTFTLSNGTVSGGVTRDGGGNVYSNGTINISGGKLEAGLSGATWANHTDYASERTYANANASNSNVFLVNSHLYMSGGEIDTGMASTRTTNDERTIKFSGDAKVLGTGITLGSTSKTVTENGTTYYNLDTVDGTELTSDGQVYISANRLGYFDDYIRLNVALDDEAYSSALFKEAAPDTCQVVYMTAANAPDGEGGIYLYNGAKYRFHCLCGANEGEEHLPLSSGAICDGTELVWRAWTSTTLPTEPGNWFLYYTSFDSGTDGEETVKYKAIKTGSLKSDYYQDSDGNWHAVRALLDVNESGSFTTMEDKSFKQATDANGNPIWLTSDGNAVADLGSYQVVDSYTINVDLNGYKLEGPTDNRSLTFYGRSEFNVTTDLAAALVEYSGVYTVETDGTEVQKYSTHRQGKVTYTIVDASQGHTAVLATAGRYSGKTRTSYTQPQGTNIWMYWQEDTLNTYRTTIDASSSIHGWGMALTVAGTANLYDTTMIGGTAQGYYSKTETLTDSEGTEHEVNTLSGSVVGGGALYISETGVVNMYGGEIKNGVSIYRYMDGTNGVDADRAVGGGNVYTDGEFNVKGTSTYPASITGGQALYYAETDGEVNDISTYATKQGGGVYLSSGTMTVEGNVTITGNTIGTISAAKEGSVPGTVVPTDITGETTNNLFLNGNTVTVKALTGTVGFTMNGTTWEGIFAEVDTEDTSYAGTNLIPDAQQTNTVTYADGYLRYVAQVDTLQVGYGSHSIYPTVDDIRNGLILGGYGNTSFSSSSEMMRMTRYWTNTTAGTSVPATDPDYEGVDMRAVAMAFRDTEGDTVIIINLDYNSVAEEVGNNLKRMISHATGVPMDNITIAASHQHTGPNISKTYWQDLDGNYTQARDLTSVTEGTYADLIYGNAPLEDWEERNVRTNYAETFYTGVLAAAVEAYRDLADVVSISGGVMDTTTGGNQYNFVRNIALYNANDLATVAGMITDNHRTTYSDSLYVKEYESQLDVTMQLVKYERADKTIVLANFQSHPHLSDGSDNLNPTGGVVEIFRQNLSKAYGTAEKPCQVLYFSGAGGNVNSTTAISSDDSKQPWYVLGSDGTTYVDMSADAANAPAQRAIKAKYHGEGLATLANEFLGDSSKLTLTVEPKTANVQATVQAFEYQVWDETQSYIVSGVEIPATWSDTKLENAKKLVDWEKGGYLYRPGLFNNTNIFEKNTSYWQYFVGNQANNNDKIYSFFHANGVRKRLLRKEAENMTGTISITAYDLGGIGFIAAPYEMFQENGQAIKGNVQSTLQASQYEKYKNFPDYVTEEGCGYIVKNSTTGQETAVSSPYAITIVASQANAAQGYIPSVIGYKNGGYATDTSLFEPGTGEQLVTAFVDMLINLNANNTATTAEGE